MVRARFFLVLPFALAVLACAPGCLLAPPAIIASAGLSVFQASTTAYINGELESADAVPMAVMYQAAIEALGDLHMEITNQRLGDNEATVNSREIGGRAVKVYFERKSPMVTKMNIRVGVFGDRAMSQLLQQAIYARRPADFEVPEAPNTPPARRGFDFPQ